MLCRLRKCGDKQSHLPFPAMTLRDSSQTHDPGTIAIVTARARAGAPGPVCPAQCHAHMAGCCQAAPALLLREHGKVSRVSRPVPPIHGRGCCQAAPAGSRWRGRRCPGEQSEHLCQFAGNNADDHALLRLSDERRRFFASLMSTDSALTGSWTFPPPQSLR